MDLNYLFSVRWIIGNAQMIKKQRRHTPPVMCPGDGKNPSVRSVGVPSSLICIQIYAIQISTNLPQAYL